GMNMRRNKPVHTAKHSILLMHAAWHTAHNRGGNGRQRRITAKADQRGRLHPLQNSDAPRDTRNDGGHGFHHADKPATGRRRGRHFENICLGKQLVETLHTLICHQYDLAATAAQFLRKRLTGKEMPARSTSSDDNGTGRMALHALIPLPFGAATLAPARRRVSASNMPIEKASARSEEPP